MGIVFAEDTMVNRDPFTNLFQTIFKQPNLFQTIFKQPGCLAVVDNWWAVAGVGPAQEAEVAGCLTGVDNWWAVAGVGPAQEAEVAGNSKVRPINLGNYNCGPLWQGSLRLQLHTIVPEKPELEEPENVASLVS